MKHTIYKGEINTLKLCLEWSWNSIRNFIDKLLWVIRVISLAIWFWTKGRSSLEPYAKTLVHSINRKFIK